MKMRRASPEDNHSHGTMKLHHLTVAMTGLMCGLLFPVAQMVCFGTTDYRRTADVIVVFGAKVYADGRLSSILEERVRTGCALYHEGLAPQILFSGGPGIGQVHETEGMRRRALELGVPAAAISVDLNGIDTESTAINTLRIGQSQNWNRILAVSQFFHLPRIKLAFHRHGSEVYTVPAKRLYYFGYLPYSMLREIAAWWFTMSDRCSDYSTLAQVLTHSISTTSLWPKTRRLGLFPSCPSRELQEHRCSS